MWSLPMGADDSVVEESPGQMLQASSSGGTAEFVELVAARSFAYFLKNQTCQL